MLAIKIASEDSLHLVQNGEKSSPVHNPYSYLPPGPCTGPLGPISIAEAGLLEIIVDVMNDRSFNRFSGSVAIEKVQNAVSQQKPWLLRMVLRGRTFSAFIEAHPELFQIVAIGCRKKRMRYVLHSDWEAADRKMRSMRHKQNSHVESMLVGFLMAQPSKSCCVDDFIEAYPSLPSCAPTAGHPELPKRGDLVRLVRHRTARFIFDDVTHHIQLRPAGTMPNLHSPPSSPNLHSPQVTFSSQRL